VLREPHAASDRKQNRTAGLQGGGELRPQKRPAGQADTLRFAQVAGGHCTQKRGLDSPLRPKPAATRQGPHVQSSMARGDRMPMRA
jgi:hypothetical protein